MIKAELTGKTALITGGGSGIGRATALRFCEDGIVTVLVGRREDKLNETKELVEKAGGSAFVITGDITESEFRNLCIEETVRLTGGLDILVNNAGMALSCPYEEVTEELYDQVMDLNTKAQYFMCQKAVPYLRKSDCATIINITSVVSHKGYGLQSVYAASKHAFLGFSKSLAAELYKENIRVHAISPGGVYTDLIKIARPDLSPEGMILAEDIADIAAFYVEHRNTDAVVDEICVHRIGKEPFA